MKITFTSAPSARSEKRSMGGYVNFASRGVKTDEAIFGQVEELRLNGVPSRIVKAGSALDTALRQNLKGSCVGGDPIVVSSCKNEMEFTIEYKTGYGASKAVAAPADDDEDEPDPDDEDDEDGNGS